MVGKTNRIIHVMDTLQTSAGMDVEKSLKSVTNLMLYRQQLARKLLSAKDGEEHTLLDNEYSSVEDQIKRALAII